MIRKSALATVLPALAALALVLPALPAAAEVNAQKTDALIAAIAALGCEVSEENNARVLATADTTEDEAAEIVAALLQDGRAEIVGGSLRLRTGGCS